LIPSFVEKGHPALLHLSAFPLRSIGSGISLLLASSSLFPYSSDGTLPPKNFLPSYPLPHIEFSPFPPHLNGLFIPTSRSIPPLPFERFILLSPFRQTNSSPFLRVNFFFFPSAHLVGGDTFPPDYQRSLPFSRIPSCFSPRDSNSGQLPFTRSQISGPPAPFSFQRFPPVFFYFFPPFLFFTHVKPPPLCLHLFL